LTAQEKKTILLVEDQVLIALNEQNALEARGYRVLLQHSGEAAVKAVACDAGIDLILMDIDLGRGMDGTEAAKRILAIRSLPIVFNTAHAEQDMVERVRGITRYGYVIKNSGDFVLQSSIEMAFELFDANRRLAESEARFRNILRDVPSIAVQGYGPDGRTQYWNKASERLYGYSSEEAIGRRLPELIIPPEMREAVEGAIRQMAATGQAIPAAELSLMHKDGSRVPVFSSHTIVQVEGREQELFCLDISLSERNKAEEAFRLSEEIFKGFLEHSPIYVFFKDEEGRSLKLSANFEKFLGRPLTELLGKTMDSLFPASMAEKMAADDRMVLQEGKIISVDEELDGRYYTTIKFPIQISGGPRYLAGYTIDITERVEAQERIRRLLAERGPFISQAGALGC